MSDRYTHAVKSGHCGVNAGNLLFLTSLFSGSTFSLMNTRSIKNKTTVVCDYVEGKAVNILTATKA